MWKEALNIQTHIISSHSILVICNSSSNETIEDNWIKQKMFLNQNFFTNGPSLLLT